MASEVPSKRKYKARPGGPGSVPTLTRKVRGVGRYAKHRYCERCGHTKGRCICRS